MKKTTTSLMVDYGISKHDGAIAVSVDACDSGSDFDYDAAVNRMSEYSRRTNEQYRKSLDDIKCGRVYSRDEVMARLAAAQAKLLAAAPMLLSSDFKFNGDEINGPRK